MDIRVILAPVVIFGVIVFAVTARQAFFSGRGNIKLESKYREFQELREKVLNSPDDRMEITDKEFVAIVSSLKENSDLPYLDNAIDDFKAGRPFFWMGKEIKRQQQPVA